MGQYKVPQDVEAEDKILGPLTLKQFIYAIVAIAWAGLCFFLFRKIVSLMIIVGAPVVMLFLLLAFYKRDGQNFEQLLIALASYFANSRVRIWRKEEVVESFHVEAAKPKEEVSQRNPTEVRAELARLATLADSRGITHPISTMGMVMPAAPGQPAQVAAAPIIPEEPAADMYDIQGSAIGANLNALIEQAAADVKKEAMAQMAAAPTTAPAPQKSVSTNVTTAPSSDILKLASESELTVSQLAAQATRLAPIVEGQSVDLRNNAKPSQ